jgi:hypothetical protein
MAKLVVLLLTPRTYLPMLEIVRHYKYLGRMLSINGSFTHALLDLTRRGQKAFFKLKNIFNNIPCSAYPWKYLVFLKDSGCTNY